MTPARRGPAPAAPRLVVAYADDSAHRLLRREAAEFHRVPAAHVLLAHTCGRCGSDAHGRPVVRPVTGLRDPAHVSLSRTRSLAVVAITDLGPVGVDAESRDAPALREIRTVALHPWELARDVDAGRAWVRKEAVLKACGFGLRVDPRDIALDEGRIVAWECEQPPPGDVHVRDLEIPGVVAAVAVIVPAGRRLDDVPTTCRLSMT